MGEDTGADKGMTRGDPRRVTLRAAAAALGVSEGAVRKRVTRGTLASDIGSDGRRYVYLEGDEAGAATGEDAGSDEGNPGGEDTSADALLEAYQRENELLRDTLAAERRANEENRRIIAGLVQRIPELEAPPASAQEAESVAESASEGVGGEEAGDKVGSERQEERTAPQSTPRRAWWRSLKRLLNR